MNVAGSMLLYEAFALDLPVQRQRPAGGHDYDISQPQGFQSSHNDGANVTAPGFSVWRPSALAIVAKPTLLITSFFVASVYLFSALVFNGAIREMGEK